MVIMILMDTPILIVNGRLSRKSLQNPMIIIVNYGKKEQQQNGKKVKDRIQIKEQNTIDY